MQNKQRNLIIEAVRNVLIVFAIYLSIWLSGFHDTDRRWSLLICLFGVWGAFLLGRSSGPRARAASSISDNVGEDEMAQRRVASPDWAWGAVALLIIAVGLLVRFST
jgi:hypothetical protein